MDARLAAVASMQHGVFTREQAIASGLSPGQVDYQLRSRRWRRVLPRVYRDASRPTGDSAPRWAAVLWAGPGAALSHTTAAALWRLPVAPFGTEVTVPRRRALTRVASVCVHRPQHFDAADVQQLRGLPVTTPLRTLVDLAAILDDRAFAAALEAASGRGLVSVAAASQRRLFRAATKRWRR